MAIWRGFVFGLALLLVGCGDSEKPASCQVEVVTWYEWNSITNLWMGPYTEPRCIVGATP